MHRSLRFPIALCLGFFAVGFFAVAHAQQTPPPANPPPSNPGQPSAGAAVITPDDMIENALKLLDTGDGREAYAVTDRVKRIKPDHPRLKLMDGLFLVETRRSAEALASLSQYNESEAGKKDYRGYAAVGSIYKKSHAYPSAERPFELAQKLAPLEVNGRPVRAEIMIEYASVLQKLKKSKQAMTALKEAETLAPNDAGVQINLGEVSLESQDYEPALRYADRAAELTTSQLRSDPFKQKDLERLRDCYGLKIRVTQAQQAAKPDDAPPLFIMAEATRAMGEAGKRLHYLEARELALKALSKDPKQNNWRIFLAQVELELGGVQDAIDHVNEVLKEDPQNAAGLKFKEEMQARMKAASAP